MPKYNEFELDVQVVKGVFYDDDGSTIGSGATGPIETSDCSGGSNTSAKPMPRN